MAIGEKVKIDEWFYEVQKARISILSSKREPTKLLTDLFELYQDDFDVGNLKGTQPEFYQMLQQFCSNPPETYEQLRERSGNLVRFFEKHRDEIRQADVNLYYALLNFIDMLKCKHIYFDLIKET